MTFRRFLAPITEASAHYDLPCGVYGRAQDRIEGSIKGIYEKVAGTQDPNFQVRALIIKEQRAELVATHSGVTLSAHPRTVVEEVFTGTRDKLMRPFGLSSFSTVAGAQEERG